MMVTIPIRAQDYAQYIRRVAAIKLPRALEAGTLAGCMHCIPIVQHSVETAPPANPAGLGAGGAFSSGTYKRSWRAGPVRGGARVYNDRTYASVIELGRRPGAKMPPGNPDVIGHWARRRLGLTEREAKSVSFVIRRAIGRRGLLPRRVLGRALPAMNQAVNQEIVRALVKAY